MTQLLSTLPQAMSRTYARTQMQEGMLVINTKSEREKERRKEKVVMGKGVERREGTK